VRVLRLLDACAKSMPSSSPKSQDKKGRATLFCPQRAPQTKEQPMPDIMHLIKIRAAPEQVYQALTTAEGIRNW
jgi:hypothetical protein